MGLLAHMFMLFAYSQEKMMQHVGAGLVAIQASTRMRPPDPDSVAAAVIIHAAPGSEAAAKDLLFKLDSMQAQVAILLLCSLIMHSLVRHHALSLLSTAWKVGYA